MIGFPKENGQLYTLYGGHVQTTYADATNYFIGAMPTLAPGATAVNVIKFKVPFDSWLRQIKWGWRAIPVNATEIVRWDMLIYDANNILKDTRPVAWFPFQQSFGASATANSWCYTQDMKIPMRAGDEFIFLINQTWVNNPTNITLSIDCSFQIR